ncbi:MAG: small redox-active disulfide protein 2 [Desulforhopalus sp.]|jgi:small redox-active disulfide protein 2
MEIKICGPGCAKCEEAHKNALSAVEKSGRDVTVTKVTDFQQIAVLGIFTTPAVVVDGVVKCVGRGAGEDEIISWLEA